MCYVIYAALILLFGLYCDSLLQSLVLATTTGDGGLMTMALGWEMVPHLWPLLALAAVISSLLTYQVVVRLMARKAD